MRATVVIGSNLGDESKGKMVDYFAAPYGARAVVCRYNGGAQAGHTVVMPDGERHVFHHFGSGTLTGAATYLSKHFIVNPLLWDKEREELKNKGYQGKLIIDPRAFVTTPYDMLVNQAAQAAAGSRASCGVGINETVVRSAIHDLAFDVEHLDNAKGIRRLCENLRVDYVPSRMRALGISPSTEFLDRLHSDRLIEEFVSACERLYETAFPCKPRVMRQFDHIVFEGAQGLLLDEDHRFFPYVTRSKTGLRNPVEIAKRIGLEGLDAVYVTRAYMTRHGDGPFPTYDPGLRYDDPTNVPNEFQGTMRFGSLDVPLLNESIANDMLDAGDFDVRSCVAVTCADQVENADAIIDSIPNVRYVSRGPKRSDVEERKNVSWRYNMRACEAS